MRLNLAAPVALPIFAAPKLEKESGKVMTPSCPVCYILSSTSRDKIYYDLREPRDSVLERYQYGMLTSPSSLSFLFYGVLAAEFRARPGYLIKKSFFIS